MRRQLVQPGCQYTRMFGSKWAVLLIVIGPPWHVGKTATGLAQWPFDYLGLLSITCDRRFTVRIRDQFDDHRPIGL